MSDQNQNGFKIEFKKSGFIVHWNKDVESLIELAEDAGVYAVSGC